MRHTPLQETDAVILCGGLGTRLRGVIEDRPKPMAEIEGRPFLDILIDYVAGYDINRFILCTGYRGDFIKRYYEKREGNLKFIISEEKEPLGTAGAIKNAETFIESNPFLVLNGDSFCQVDVSDFYRSHLEKKAFLSVVVTPVEDSRDYGRIQLDRENRIIVFSSEKDHPGGAGFINAGVYLFNRNILEGIRRGEKVSLEYDLIPRLLTKGVYGYTTEGPLLDIGTADRLEKARNYFKGSRYVQKNRHSFD